MKTQLKHTHKQIQTYQMNHRMESSLSVLKMNEIQVREAIKQLVQNNPVVEYRDSYSHEEFSVDLAAAGKNLKEELRIQIPDDLTPTQYQKCIYIIESLDKNGFFAEDIDSPEKKKALEIVQQMEPAGVAARDSIDSIAIQLKRKNETIAWEIFTKFQQEIIQRNFISIAKSMNISQQDVLDSLEKIRECSPFPCSEYETESPILLIPDIFVEILDGEVHISTQDNSVLQIQENGVDDPSLKEFLQQAQFFIDDLNRRNQTLLLLANSLFKIQETYFLFHDELHPCTLMDLSRETGFHVSTVSRTLSDKYYEYAGEIYPVKQLFVSSTREGTGKASAQQAIRRLVDQENREYPLQDEELMERLEEMDLYVSRRAVTKYRNQLGIPNSKQRKKKYTAKKN